MSNRMSILVTSFLLVITIWASFYGGYLLDLGMFKHWYDIPYVCSCIAMVLLIPIMFIN